ncbi:MAG: hypothetical protein DRJ61_07150 [Acidobacteria bacterium]|nr:MAG: hypothetical protein DRJ61_07150 [Acidobacteriota bacterium]
MRETAAARERNILFLAAVAAEDDVPALATDTATPEKTTSGGLIWSAPTTTWDVSALGPKSWWRAQYYYRARWYEPGMVGFLQADPYQHLDSSNRHQAFGFSGFNNLDPSGKWVFDYTFFPDWKQYELDIKLIKDRARRLLLNPLTVKYLKFRFGDAAITDAYLRGIASDGQGPRVGFDTSKIPSGARARYDQDSKTIEMKSNDFKSLSKFVEGGRNLNVLHDLELYEGLGWAHATTLAHETIHFIDHDTDSKSEFDAGIPGYDIADKWEYYLFGKYGGGWGPRRDYVGEDNENDIVKFFHWVEVMMSPDLIEKNKERYQERWDRIVKLMEGQKKQHEKEQQAQSSKGAG